MILGVIGPSLIVDKFQTVARDVPRLTLRPLLYETMLDAPGIAAGAQTEVDALFFSGVLPYFMAASVVQPAVPWFYLERPISGLPFAFLEAGKFMERDVRFSIDTFSELDINDAMLDCRFSIDAIYTYPLKPSERYHDDLLEFHLSHLQAGRTKFCITCAYVVFRKLQAMDVPVFFVTPSVSAVREALASSMKAFGTSDGDHLKLVVGLLLPEKLPVPLNQYEQAMRTIRRSVSAYAKKKGILVFQRNTSIFQSVQTYSQFLIETENFGKVPIFDEIVGETSDIRLRIGYGIASNIATAERYAEKALDMGLCTEGNECHLFDGESGWAVGEREPSYILAAPDADFQVLSAKINITPATLSRYLKAIGMLGPSFSAADFSRILGLQPKSARKILARFRSAGLIVIDSSRAPLRKGRPENLYRYVPDGAGTLLADPAEVRCGGGDAPNEDGRSREGEPVSPKDRQN